MTDRPITPWLFRLQLEHTPSPNDPIGAWELYQALGTLVVAWGRLETHFLACVMAILATDATRGLSRKMPMAWDQRARIWKDAFRISPALKVHEYAALDLLARIQQVSDDRNLFIHGLWERFNHGLPLSAGLVMMRYKKGTRNEITHSRHVVTVDDVWGVAQRADQLNIELIGVSKMLAAERGQLPPEIYTP